MIKNLRINKFSICPILIFIGFLIFSLFGILNHEMWRDELQAWMLARDSRSIVELYQNMQFEGHPALWHICLFGLSQITHNPLIMQLFHWLISLCVAYLILNYSPFTLFQKFLLTFSYFIFFEYTLISRNYNLAILFSFLFCILYARSKSQYILYALLLALLANTSAYGFLMSLILFLHICLNNLSQRKWSRFSFYEGNWRPKIGIKLTSSIAIAILGWLTSAFQMVRADVDDFIDFAELGFRAYTPATSTAGFIHLNAFTAFDFDDLRHASRAINGIWESYFPLPTLFTLNFWDANILSYSDSLGTFKGVAINDLVAVFSSISLLLFIGYLFSRKLIIFWTYLLGNLLLFGFHIFIFKGFFIRHEGFFLILFIVCSWLLLSSESQNHVAYQLRSINRRSIFSTLLTVILSAQLIAGVYAVSMDYIHPFSAGKATAQYIETNGFTNSTILGSQHRQASVISGYLDIPIYYPELGRSGSFWRNDHAIMPSEQNLLKDIDFLIHKDPNHSVVLALTEPLNIVSTYNTAEFPNIRISFLTKFDRTIVEDEKFYLYLAQRR